MKSYNDLNYVSYFKMDASGYICLTYLPTVQYIFILSINLQFLYRFAIFILCFLWEDAFGLCNRQRTQQETINMNSEARLHCCTVEMLDLVQTQHKVSYHIS
jgi:hypothetical protein